ncbi:MAG: hypothetical protein GTO55_05370, partial [Armatimonadetes bacterium]|nr:hypothetical protein [Armatimonadota bacterium]NIM23690.1 hypothetical protein [Armatimonadota bacterium]NIM67564.1 hypothetical protein [Armatimonadota bacterium]NIM76077.1 hypothetical protein [Armatimonadota bacterium]NIN05748.1 hypothetical protein [Armatimonadota bacterium]
MSHNSTDTDAVGPQSVDRERALADATALLATGMREIAELNWSAYALGELPNLSVGAQVHEQLLAVRRLLLKAEYTPPAASDKETRTHNIPYAVCRNIVETDPLILALRTHAGETRRIIKRTLQKETSRLSPEEQALRLGDFLAPIVREMIRRRNRHARDFGSRDYTALTVDSIGLNVEQLKEWLIEVSNALGGCIASGLRAPSLNDNRYLHYHEEVGRRLEEAEPLVVLNDANLPELAKTLGIDPSRLSKDLQSAPEMEGWCLSVNRPDEIRLVLTKEKPLTLGFVLHELGHYLHETAPAPKGWQL